MNLVKRDMKYTLHHSRCALVVHRVWDTHQAERGVRCDEVVEEEQVERVEGVQAT